MASMPPSNVVSACSFVNRVFVYRPPGSSSFM